MDGVLSILSLFLPHGRRILKYEGVMPHPIPPEIHCHVNFLTNIDIILDSRIMGELTA